MSEQKEHMCCLDVDVGLNQMVLYIGAVGCFLATFFIFASYFLLANPFAVVLGIVAFGLGVLMLVACK